MSETSSQPAGSILVVDDEPRNCLLARGSLERVGYEVSVCDSGVEALELLSKVGADAFDLILLDVLMPKIDGFETCARIRRLPGGGDTPVLFLTALNDPDSYQRALEVGGDDYLTKPVRQAELLLRVRSLVRIKALLNDLCSHRDALLVAQEQRRRLTRMIVHDLKGPLQAILGYAELLQTGAEGDATSKYSHQILQAGERAHRLITKVLETEEDPDPKVVAVKNPIDLGGFLERILEAGRESGRATGHVFRLSAGADPQLEADEGLLERILNNLVQNAVQHSPPGEVEIHLAPSERGVRFEVRDCGAGVPRAMRERIFEPHFQLSRRTPRNQGLGLAFCRLAVQAHGGRIWVEDNEPQGARFCFTLPAPAPTPAGSS